MTSDVHSQVVKDFSGKRVAVVGDLMMDEYLWGRATRISPESPVMVIDVDRESSVPGGAANVVNNLLALGARVSVYGVVGADAAGASLIEALRAEGADVEGIGVDSSRATTRKTRVVAHSQQVLRVDREQRHAIPAEVGDGLLSRLTEQLPDVNAVLISDYLKGVVTPHLAAGILKAARQANVIVTANPKPRSARILSGCTVLQLNQSEAIEASGDSRFASDPDLEEAGATLAESLCVETLIVTRGPKGLVYWQKGGGFGNVPAHAVEVYDVAGAGDTVISALTLSLASGSSVAQAAAIANHAAACVVRKVGVATVSQEELLQLLA
jgi:D-beta-D-heptose 7-phosphate kinase/D-beta-D-heptose 1-phosphate adenosyltransferase